jgi:hypothetical protein
MRMAWVAWGEVQASDGGCLQAADLGATVAAVADVALDGEGGLQVHNVTGNRTVRDLIVGSDIVLDDRGTQLLRGVEGTWQLFAVVGP